MYECKLSRHKRLHLAYFDKAKWWIGVLTHINVIGSKLRVYVWCFRHHQIEKQNGFPILYQLEAMESSPGQCYPAELLHKVLVCRKVPQGPEVSLLAAFQVTWSQSRKRYTLTACCVMAMQYM